MDYERLIDAETRAFIDRVSSFYAGAPGEMSLDEERRSYAAMCASFAQPRPAGVSTEDFGANGVPVRVYSAGDPTRTVVYLHGGGFVLGGLDSHDGLCAEICAQTGYRVIGVEYRLCPEHRHPAQFEDCWTAAEWAAVEYGEPLILAGDSAGGTLAACVAHHARGRLDQVLGQVLIYPLLGGDTGAGSYLEHADAPILTRADVLYYEAARCDGHAPGADPTYLPLQDSDFADLPPTVIFAAEFDPLRDDGPAYRDRIRAAGGQAHCVIETGLMHSYLRGRGVSARAADAFERVSVAIEALGQEIWPYG